MVCDGLSWKQNPMKQTRPINAFKAIPEFISWLKWRVNFIHIFLLLSSLCLTVRDSLQNACDVKNERFLQYW